MKAEVINEIVSFYKRLSESEMDHNGRIRANSKTGYRYVHAPGPIDKGFTLRVSLPNALKIFAGTKYGTVRDAKTGEKVPMGLSFDKFDTPEQAADFLTLAMEDVASFTHFIVAGDGTRYYEEA